MEVTRTTKVVPSEADVTDMILESVMNGDFRPDMATTILTLANLPTGVRLVIDLPAAVVRDMIVRYINSGNYDEFQPEHNLIPENLVLGATPGGQLTTEINIPTAPPAVFGNV